MIALWMLSALMFGGLLSAAAAMVERAARGTRCPVRLIWGAAIALSATWTISVGLGVLLPEPHPIADDAGSATLLPFTVSVATMSAAMAPDPARWLSSLDLPLLLSWAAASALLAIHLVRSIAALRRARSGWRSTTVDGRSVLVGECAGPAVIGLFKMEIVLPPWALELDAAARELVLLHEEEHRSARDPYLLMTAALLLVVLPWNLPVWWQSRRLRLAMEIDCDARLLGKRPEPERYGRLLIALAQRSSLEFNLLVPSLFENASHLERRIAAMTESRHNPLLRNALTAAAIALVVVACAVEHPDASVDTPVAVNPAAPIAKGEDTPNGDVVPPSPLAGNPPPVYPADLLAARVEGEVIAQFVVDEQGRMQPQTWKIVSATDPSFAAAARTAAVEWRFSPATVDGMPVRHLMQMPYVFRIQR